MVVHLLGHSCAQNDSKKKVNLRGHSMLDLTADLIFHFRENLKMHKNVKKKMHSTLQLMIHLTVQLTGAP